ncbi:DUF4124 domain-containing protein [Eikenella sp. S3360]|uniref:DUF4124 domain-containing protein n=1 Tax=Eikenella glucosivorans TaxID=2766967 RepID=A0ABS0N8U5_9NEIS|nr:DUF4124 domain-containing protein [Eikenella glucosivorans]MBH5328732.1 DUF4124 domain-containing protein [Eikenella glucosivorans]
MNKLSPLFAAGLLGLCAAASAATYECTDRQGRHTYTSAPAPGANCRAVNLGRVTTYPAHTPSAGSSTSYSGSPAAQPAAAAPAPAESAANESQRAAAAERLRQAQQNLEEGRKVRYGNERNYARYLERVGKLEEEVNRAQQEVNSFNK